MNFFGHITQFFFFIKKRPSLFFSIIIIFITAFAALTAGVIAPKGYSYINLNNSLAPPSLNDFFGTDHLGRSLFNRIIWGTRELWFEVLLTLVISGSIGIMLGIISGYYGGIVDITLARIGDILMAFPAIVLAMAIVAVLGFNLTNAVIAVAIPNIAQFFRLSRALAMESKEHLYVELARVAGVSDIKILYTHILRVIYGPIIVQATLSSSLAIINVAALSFLGLGAQPPSPEWGVILREGRNYLRTAPHVVIIPSLAIFLISFAFNNLGESLMKIFEERGEK